MDFNVLFNVNIVFSEIYVKCITFNQKKNEVTTIMVEFFNKKYGGLYIQYMCTNTISSNGIYIYMFKKI